MFCKLAAICLHGLQALAGTQGPPTTSLESAPSTALLGLVQASAKQLQVFGEGEHICQSQPRNQTRELWCTLNC